VSILDVVNVNVYVAAVRIVVGVKESEPVIVVLHVIIINQNMSIIISLLSLQYFLYGFNNPCQRDFRNKSLQLFLSLLCRKAQHLDNLRIVILFRGQ